MGVFDPFVSWVQILFLIFLNHFLVFLSLLVGGEVIKDLFRPECSLDWSFDDVGGVSAEKYTPLLQG